MTISISQTNFVVSSMSKMYDVGGMGPTCDFGWGCMLRCGQMMLAEALIRRHLSRGKMYTLFIQFMFLNIV